MEERLGHTISTDEWNAAMHHSYCPGQFNDIPPEIEESFRCKLRDDVLLRLSELLTDKGTVQQYAYGQKLIDLCGGSVVLELDNVDRLKTVREITCDFLHDAIFSEMESNLDLPPDEQRCTCMERDAFRRCMKNKSHKQSSDRRATSVVRQLLLPISRAAPRSSRRSGRRGCKQRRISSRMQSRSDES